MASATTEFATGLWLVRPALCARAADDDAYDDGPLTSP